MEKAITTIQISKKLKEELKKMKMFDGETYEDIIWDLIEDRKELSEETLKNIAEAEEDIKAGRLYSLDEVKKELGL